MVGTDAEHRAAFERLNVRYRWGVIYEAALLHPVRSRLIDLECAHPRCIVAPVKSVPIPPKVAQIHARYLDGKMRAAGEKQDDY